MTLPPTPPPPPKPGRPATEAEDDIRDAGPEVLSEEEKAELAREAAREEDA